MNTLLADAGLDELLQEMKSAPALYQPSPFWTELAAVALQQLEHGGFDNFKRSVNMAYFNWNTVGILRHQFVSVLWHWCRHPTWEIARARFTDYTSSLPAARTYRKVSDYHFQLPDVATFNPAAAMIYRLYVALLFEYVCRMDRLGLLATLDEPTLGHPFIIQYRGRSTSQDLCNSVHEFYSASGTNVSGHVAELGAGYGRLAYVFLKALPSCTYTIIDIAPALNIAQKYLTTVFPNDTTFHFRRFTRYEDVREEFEASRIRFLASHQIALLPPKSVDLFLNISSLHEMTFPQIENYLQQIDRVCRGLFYTKQWRTAKTTINGQLIREFQYPIPRTWSVLFHKRHPIQRMFFHALYQTGH